MNVTADQFKKLFPPNLDPVGWVAALNATLPAYGINTKVRVAMFLAQCGHESSGWTHFEENLNYRAPRLTVVWPRRFPPEVAKKYEGHPAAIANRAYGSRMGNGDEASGDGWKFRGRGPIQLTGRDNYTKFSMETFGDGQIVDSPDAVAHDKEVALKSALWFWKTHNLNAPSDASDVYAVTKAINGGTVGLAQRQSLFDQAMVILV